MGKNPFLQAGIVGFEWGEVNEERLAVYGELRPMNEDEFSGKHGAVPLSDYAKYKAKAPRLAWGAFVIQDFCGLLLGSRLGIGVVLLVVDVL